ncbi:MAG TPA: acyltransferase [Stellaceae bacterium]|nr:acyltransferase [Stellaceae bacterium]
MDRKNNFDALRLLAATSVIFTHAFLLAEGTQDRDPLVVLSLHQCPTGLVGVFVFFAISGFLVTQSWEQTNSLPRFLAKRALRIYPGLAACILALTFGLGAAMTTLPLGDYLRDPGTREFLGANLLMQLQPNSLPGVEFSKLWFGTVMDGPLWSLPLEASLYLMVAALGMARLIRLPVLAVLLVVGMLSVWFDKWIDAHLALGFLAGVGWIHFLAGVGWMLGFFVTGMALYKLRDRGIFNGRLALLAVLGVIASVPLQSFIPMFAVFGCYLALYAALHPSLPIIPAARFGDLSYGLYIYGWPVEQTVSYLRPGASWWELFLLSMVATAGVAFLSWHLVEKQALSFKPRGSAQPKPLPA